MFGYLFIMNEGTVHFYRFFHFWQIIFYHFQSLFCSKAKANFFGKNNLHSFSAAQTGGDRNNFLQMNPAKQFLLLLYQILLKKSVRILKFLRRLIFD